MKTVPILKVLIVDSGYDAVTTMEAMWTMRPDWEFARTTSALSALRMLKSGTCAHVIVTEIELGAGMTGLEMITQLRQRGHNMPVIVLTSSETVIYGHECSAFTPFTLVKPERVSNIISTIEEACASKLVAT